MPKAIGPKILVKVKKKERRTEGGIYLPEAKLELEDDAKTVAEVVEVGSEAYKGLAKNPSEKPWVKVGDMIYISRYGGRIFKDGTAEIYKDYVLRIINDEDVICLFEEGDPE